MGSLDEIFKLFFYALCDVAKYIIAIKMATGILKSGESHDIKSVIQELISGGFTYGALYSILNILDSVQKTVQK